MTYHYKVFAPSYEQLPRFQRPNTQGDFFMTGGKILMTGRILHRGRIIGLHSPGENFSRVRNSWGRHLSVKIRPKSGILLGKFRRPAKIQGEETYNGPPAQDIITSKKIDKQLETQNKEVDTLANRAKLNDQPETPLKQCTVTRWNSVLTMLKSVSVNSEQIQITSVTNNNKQEAATSAHIEESLLL